MGQWLGNHYLFTLLTAIIITALLIWSATKITFDQNYMNIEPAGLTSIALQDTVLEKFDMSMDYSMILANSVDESREMAKKFRELATVAMTEDISLYLPSPDQQRKRKRHIKEIYQSISNASVKNF